MPEEGSYVLTDMFHTPIRVLDRSGNTKDVYQYDVFGKQQGKGEQPSLPFGYSGYVKESVENLYFTGSRVYNEVDGRFQSKDLYRYMDYKNPASMNLYNYVQGNPLKYFDFDGHISIEEKSYWDRTIEMVTLGDYSEEVTVLGVAINIGAGLLGIDVVSDFRDLSAHVTVNRDLDSWAWWGTLGVYILAFVPGLGAVKNVLKGSEVLKYSDEVADLAFDTGKVPKTFAFLDDAGDFTKTLDKVEVGNVNSYDDAVSGMFGGVDVAGGMGEGTPIVIYGTEDIAKYEFNMIENPGPLAELRGRPAKNFYGGRYNIEVLKEDRIYYRAGNSEKSLGQWFTSEKPESVVKVRIDTAVKPQWIDPVTGELTGESTIDTVYAIKFLKGTTTYTGPVGPQGGAYSGSYDIMQTYINEPWKLNYEVISQTPLK